MLAEDAGRARGASWHCEAAWFTFAALLIMLIVVE